MVELTGSASVPGPVAATLTTIVFARAVSLGSAGDTDGPAGWMEKLESERAPESIR